MTTFADRLRQARTKRKWTRGQLSYKSGVKVGTITATEDRRTQPTIVTATRLADALNVSLDWLMGRTEDCHVSRLPKINIDPENFKRPIRFYQPPGGKIE